MRALILVLLLPAAVSGAASFATYCTPSGRVDQVVLNRVGRSRIEVRLATYSFDWPELGTLLAAKKRQGVSVRVLCDGRRGETEVAGLEEMSRVETGPGRFHAKLAVLDRKTVLVGSVNLTSSGIYLHHNDLLEVEDARIAEFCCRVFDAWWSGDVPPARLRTAEMDIYLSPGEDLARRILSEISAARRSIRFLQYRFTDAGIGRALGCKRREGLLVAGILDMSGLYPFSVLEPLRRSGCEVRAAAIAGLLHDKTVIVDDRVVITGSYNLSASARKNVEIVAVVRNEGVAKAYLAEWFRLWRWRSIPAEP